MTIEEIISKLPEEFRPLARRYTTLLINMGFEELQGWIGIVISGDYLQAYRSLVAKMSTDEIVAEQNKANEILKALNKENAVLVAAQREILAQIFMTLLLMLQGQIEEIN